MARARNIKPGFFRNAELVELPVETRLLFIGLWGLADREGRMFDRPKQIKMEVYPADNFDIDAMLDQLNAAGFVGRYEVNGIKYIQVNNFGKHQNPHRDEKASTIPAPCEHDASTVQIVLNPESLLLNPESPTKTSATASDGYPPEFENAWVEYPKRPGENKTAAFKAWKARIKAGEDPVAMLNGVRRYAAYCTACVTELQFIKLSATFFGPNRHYLSDWTIPARGGAPPSKQAHRDSYDAQAKAAQERIFGNERRAEIDITADAERIA